MNPARRLTLTALAAATVLTGAGVVALTGPGAGAGNTDWHPAAFGLRAAPASLLPDTVSTTAPVRVVSTVLDPQGRPTVTVRTATDRAAAAALITGGQHATGALGVEVDAPIRADGVPTGTDPYQSQQWNLKTVKAGAAWQKSTGAGVTVAVLDTGVDATQPDLAGQVLPGFDATGGGGTADYDPNGHGTHVAGVIAADTGNGVGISSIAPNAKILPVRVMGADGTGYMSAVAAGIVYATDHGAGVITMSFSSPTPVDAVSTAVAYARSKGVVVVAAAGNDRQSGSPVSYPAASDGVIAVGATDAADQVADFSSAGPYVDLTAPGTGILSTWPGGSVKGGTIKAMSGTSMAAPHVAAVAALIRSADPTLSPDLVESALEKSALDFGAVGRDNDYGYGRLDAAAAMSLVTATPNVPRGTGASATPTPSSTVRRARPTIRTARSRLSAYAGDAVTTSFTITAFGKPWARQPVQVCVAPAAAGYTCTGDTTSDTGVVSTTQTVAGGYAVRVVTDGTDADPVTSSAVTVLALSRISVVAAGADTIEVSMTGALGQPAQVQTMSGTRWKLLATYPADAVHDVTGLPPGRYRVVVPSTAAMVGSTSAAVTL